MTQPQTIEQACADLQSSEGPGQLTPTFFLSLHALQTKFMRLRYNHNLKSTQQELLSTMQQLLVNYTDCIDYFSGISEGAEIYYQAKLKDISRYYQLFRTTATHSDSSNGLTSTANDKHEIETIQDLGSIASQTRTRVQQLIEDKDNTLDTKDMFNQSVMVCLQHQNINVHLKENMKKKEIVENKIIQSLQNQADDIQRRIKNRKIKINKKKVSQSFSDQITFQADLRRKEKPSETYDQIEQLSNFDIEALDVDSPYKLKQLIQSKSSQVIHNEKESL